jgi:hypothetical protein
MTVAKLIEFLRDKDPNLPVYLEGCDCEGAWDGKGKETVAYPDLSVLLLTRD